MESAARRSNQRRDGFLVLSARREFRPEDSPDCFDSYEERPGGEGGTVNIRRTFRLDRHSYLTATRKMD